MPNVPASAQSKFWVFTINNPTQEDCPYQWESSDDPVVKYCLWQYEIGENGTRHIQGHLVLDKRLRLGGVKKLNSRAHWEVRRGSYQEAETYCSKEETRELGPFLESCLMISGGPHSFGEAPAEGRGARNDLLNLKRVIDRGGSLLDCFEEQFSSMVRNNRGIMLYKRLKTGLCRSWQTTCTVYFGGSGVGKSRRALADAGDSGYWLPRPEGDRPWWDGYDGQETIVIDEFYGWMKRDFLYRLIDRYPLMLEVKGGAVPMQAKHVIFTSNKHPKEWYPRVGLGALIRRFTGDIGKVFEMTGDGELSEALSESDLESYFVGNQ